MCVCVIEREAERRGDVREKGGGGERGGCVCVCEREREDRCDRALWKLNVKVGKETSTWHCCRVLGPMG